MTKLLLIFTILFAGIFVGYKCFEETKGFHPKIKTLEERMLTCDFPTYSQALECEKIKAIKNSPNCIGN